MLHGHLDDKFACAGDAQCFACGMAAVGVGRANIIAWGQPAIVRECGCFARWDANVRAQVFLVERPKEQVTLAILDRKSTRLNSSHVKISYAVFCLKKKKKEQKNTR